LHTWLENSKSVTPTPELAKRFLNAEKALSSSSDLISTDLSDLSKLARAIKQVTWPENYPALTALAEARSTLSEQTDLSAEERGVR